MQQTAPHAVDDGTTEASSAPILIAEARLELLGAAVRPPEAVRETVRSTDRADFIWSVGPLSDLDYRGTVWVYFVIVDKAASTEERVAVTAQTLQVWGAAPLGIGGHTARLLGSLGLVCGLALALSTAAAMRQGPTTRRRTDE
jgi:hypothetical protein